MSLEVMPMVECGAALALVQVLDTVRVPRGDIVAIGVLLLVVLFAPLRMASNLNHCVRDLREPGETTLLESFLTATPTASRVAVRRTRSALHVRVFSGAIGFNRHVTHAHPAAMTTIVTTEQVQIRHVDATLCVRAQGERTSIAVLEGAVQVSALEIAERFGGSGGNGDAGREIFVMSLRSGDRAEILRRGSDLVVRLESGTGTAEVCSLTGIGDSRCWSGGWGACPS